MSLLQDIEITEIGFPMPEFIQLCARRVPEGHESAHNCMNECMGKPISVISISCKSHSQDLRNKISSKHAKNRVQMHSVMGNQKSPGAGGLIYNSAIKNSSK